MRAACHPACHLIAGAGTAEPALRTGRRRPMRTTRLLAVSAHRSAALSHGLLRRVRRPRDDRRRRRWRRRCQTTPDAGAADGVGPRRCRGARPRTAPARYEGGAASNAVDLATQQALIKTGAVALRSDDVGQTRYDVQVLVDEHGGQVADDKTETDKSGEPLRSRMVLRVPVDDFDEVMDALARLDTLASTTTSSEDVTTQLIDVEARIKVQTGQRRSGCGSCWRGPQSIRDIMAIEAEIANRQAQLDSLLPAAGLPRRTRPRWPPIKVNLERKPDAAEAAPEGRRLPASSPACRRLGRPRRPPSWPSPPWSAPCSRSRVVAPAARRPGRGCWCAMRVRGVPRRCRPDAVGRAVCLRTRYPTLTSAHTTSSVRHRDATARTG